MRAHADGVLAGSVVTMIEAVQNLHALGHPSWRLLRRRLDPARIVRRPELGVLRPGGDADIVVLTGARDPQGARGGRERVAPNGGDLMST
jgi:N-acetylglucosamine-6-phosphate deacetylase